MTALTFKYPVQAFRADSEGPRHFERFTAYFDEQQITTFGAKGLKAGGPVGSLLVDSAGGAWQVRALNDFGASGSLVERTLGSLFGGAPRRIELELVESAPVSIDDIKTRI